MIWFLYSETWAKAVAMTYAINPNINQLTAPPVALVQEWISQYQGAAPMIDMSQAVPGYPPHQDMMTALAEEAKHGDVLGYGAIEGEPELRDAYLISRPAN